MSVPVATLLAPLKVPSDSGVGKAPCTAFTVNTSPAATTELVAMPAVTVGVMVAWASRAVTLTAPPLALLERESASVVASDWIVMSLPARIVPPALAPVLALVVARTVEVPTSIRPPLLDDAPAAVTSELCAVTVTLFAPASAAVAPLTLASKVACVMPSALAVGWLMLTDTRPPPLLLTKALAALLDLACTLMSPLTALTSAVWPTCPTTALTCALESASSVATPTATPMPTVSISLDTVAPRLAMKALLPL